MAFDPRLKPAPPMQRASLDWLIPAAEEFCTPSAYSDISSRAMYIEELVRVADAIRNWTALLLRRARGDEVALGDWMHASFAVAESLGRVGTPHLATVVGLDSLAGQVINAPYCRGFAETPWDDLVLTLASAEPADIEPVVAAAQANEALLLARIDELVSGDG